MKEVDKKFHITYVDDNPDPYLEEYLEKYLELKDNLGVKIDISYTSVIFDSSKDDYLTLIENFEVKKANILIIDSRLFENAVVRDNGKFTGEEFKIIFSTINPFTEVIVISQNDHLEQYGTIKKYQSAKNLSREDSYDEEAKKHYDNHLRELIKVSIEKIDSIRAILSYLKSDSSTAFNGSNIIDKIENLMKGFTEYNELTDKKIDELISFIENEIKPKLTSGKEG